MNHLLLEVCVDSVESALAAKEGGADRIELCSNLVVGGTTPSTALFKAIKHYGDIPVHVLIRPRFGDFCYSDYEFEIIQEEIRMFRELGAEGVVIGCLNPQGALHMEQMKRLMEEAKEMSVTLHRAFDVCLNPLETLNQAMELGIHTILSSGQKNTCMEGKDLLKELILLSKGQIEIMPGGGVTAEVLGELATYTKAPAYHMSGKVVLDSPMMYRKEGVTMGVANLSEYEIWQTSKVKIQQARQVLDRM